MVEHTPLDDFSGNEPMRDSLAEGKDVLSRSLTAGRWSLANTFIQNVLAYGTFLITARLLLPADFGSIAIIGIIPNLLDALTALSFESALVQKKGGEEGSYLNVAWTFAVIRGCVIFLITFLVAPLAARLFNGKQYLLLFQLSGVLLGIQAFGNVGQVYFFRALDFKKIFFRDMATATTQTVVTITAVFVLRTYWGLFVGDIASSIAVVLATFALSSYRPRFDWRLNRLQHLLPYSQWIFGQGLLGQLARTVEDSSVARFATTAEVGLFTKTKGLAYAPVSPIVSLINKIGFSAYSRVQDSLDHVREGFNKSFEILIFVGVPFLGAVYLAGHRIIVIMFGSQWGSSYIYLQILATAAVIDVVTTTLIGPLFNALGRPRRQFIGQAIYLGTLVALVALLVPSCHAYGAAFAMLGASVVTGIYSAFALHNLVALHLERVLGSLGMTILAVVVPVIPGSFLLRLPFANTTFGFIAIGLAIGGIYLGVLIAAGAHRIGPWRTIRLVLRSAAVR